MFAGDLNRLDEGTRLLVSETGRLISLFDARNLLRIQSELRIDSVPFLVWVALRRGEVSSG